jgi:tRNA (cytosine34-C5)-methyltransferase
LEFVGWKGKNSLRAYVPKNERVHYMRLIGCDTSKYEKNKFEERRANNATNNEQEDEGNGGAAKQEILD